MDSVGQVRVNTPAGPAFRHANADQRSTGVRRAVKPAPARTGASHAQVGQARPEPAPGPAVAGCQRGAHSTRQVGKPSKRRRRLLAAQVRDAGSQDISILDFSGGGPAVDSAMMFFFFFADVVGAA